MKSGTKSNQKFIFKTTDFSVNLFQWDDTKSI